MDKEKNSRNNLYILYGSKKKEQMKQSKNAKHPDNNQALALSLTPNEIYKGIFSAAGVFTTSFGSWELESIASDKVEVKNGNNACRLFYTDSVSSEEDCEILPEDIHRDMIIELKIDGTYLMALYEVTLDEGPAAYEYQKKLAESDFVKAAALIGCRVEYRLVPT